MAHSGGFDLPYGFKDARVGLLTQAIVGEFLQGVPHLHSLATRHTEWPSTVPLSASELHSGEEASRLGEPQWQPCFHHAMLLRAWGWSLGGMQ